MSETPLAKIFVTTEMLDRCGEIRKIEGLLEVRGLVVDDEQRGEVGAGRCGEFVGDEA